MTRHALVLAAFIACARSQPTPEEVTEDRGEPAPTSTTEAPSFAVTVAAPSGGSVTSSPAGIDCGADCVERFASGAQVTLTATAAATRVFANWGGACAGTSNTCALAVTAAAEVSANFTLKPTLTVQVTGFGVGRVDAASGISVCTKGGGVCEAIYEPGASVTLTATAATGWSPLRW